MPDGTAHLSALRTGRIEVLRSRRWNDQTVEDEIGGNSHRLANGTMDFNPTRCELASHFVALIRCPSVSEQCSGEGKLTACAHSPRSNRPKQALARDTRRLDFPTTPQVIDQPGLRIPTFFEQAAGEVRIPRSARPLGDAPSVNLTERPRFQGPNRRPAGPSVVDAVLGFISKHPVSHPCVFRLGPIPKRTRNPQRSCHATRRGPKRTECRILPLFLVFRNDSVTCISLTLR